jgi:hypothetical protein
LGLGPTTYRIILGYTKFGYFKRQEMDKDPNFIYKLVSSNGPIRISNIMHGSNSIFNEFEFELALSFNEPVLNTHFITWFE